MLFYKELTSKVIVILRWSGQFINYKLYITLRSVLRPMQENVVHLCSQIL